LNSNKLVAWRKIAHVVVGRISDGWEKKMSKVEYRETWPSVLIEYRKPKLQDLSFTTS
jgi:hypothetical protein